MMTLPLAAGDGLMAMALAIVLATIYLLLVRFIDLNEKEPLWAMATVFGVGGVAALALHSFGDAAVLRLDLVTGPLTVEAVRFVAVAVALGVLALVGRSRGYGEVHGLLDGVVYGIAVGLGFATGAVAAQTFAVGDSAAVVVGAAGSSPLSQLWPLALSGLSEGIFGGIIGAGFGAAMETRTAARRVGFILGGGVLAAVSHVFFVWFTHGNAFGSGGALRASIGLALPAVLLAAVAIAALRAETRIISSALPTERATGAVTDDDLALLRSFTTRRGAYLTCLLRGDVDGWMALKTLHNRQVQLAFAKDAVAKHGDEDPALTEEVVRLRTVITALREDTESIPRTTPQTDAMGA